MFQPRGEAVPPMPIARKVPERARAAADQGLDGASHNECEHTPLDPLRESPTGEHLGIPGQGQAFEPLGLVGKKGPRAPGVR